MQAISNNFKGKNNKPLKVLHEKAGKIKKMEIVAYKKYVRASLCIGGLQGNNFKIILKNNVLTICFVTKQILANGHNKFELKYLTGQQSISLPYVAYDAVVSAKNIDGTLNILIAKKEPSPLLDAYNENWQQLDQYSKAVAI